MPRPSLLLLALALACACRAKTATVSEVHSVTGRAFERASERHRMVDGQLAARDIDDAEVLRAMRAVPRHRFMPEAVAARAYEDRAQAIGHEVTISQPYIVALMTQTADIEAGERVLEVGTGSGYQAAVLAELGAQVYTIERIEALADRAAATLRELGYSSIEVRHGDGYAGWPERAPFDAIIVTAAPPELPRALTDQLAIGGKLVAPVGRHVGWQQLVVIERSEHGLEREKLLDVAFVPMLPGLDSSRGPGSK
ncbi:Protein-L-isoaspartate O-methyltransferase [Enhygromyxa salina]|uniref:Protein-L-isoaspartate O-methyltransferase n=1 Tax=Enhygromyxa salina TaxID=215803 RepID=A0A2S9YCV6_9BACT|nr:protein-L-isoaspartate(D-aspartate) O-methyltransferase [Enhygromyxa salina]PRQ02939.1 Protein-L-isoaspartate O-methyltransferase [Enhygromyxa salina]